jgi:hypothetical protein
MLLDRKEEVVGSLETIKKTYLKLVVLKQLEDDAYDRGEYRSLYELSCDERVLVDDINGRMKHIVPDLVWLKNEEDIRPLLLEIDKLQESLLKKSLSLKRSLEQRVRDTKSKLETLTHIPHYSPVSAPRIVNIRA